MTEPIVSQDSEQVKWSICYWPGCGHVTVPGHPLCPDCKVWERTEWDNQDAERQTCYAGAGR